MKSHVPFQCFSAIGGERETGDLYCSHRWTGQVTPYWSMLSKATTYQDGPLGSLPARSSYKVQLNIFNLLFKFSHDTYWQIGSQVAAQGILAAAAHEAWALRPSCCAHQLHTGVLELAQTPYPDSKGSPNRARLPRKTICRGWGSNVEKHSWQTGFSTDSSTTSHCIKKTHSLKDLFITWRYYLFIIWMGKDRRKRGSSFKVKNLFTKLKFKVELERQILDLLFNFKSPSVLMPCNEIWSNMALSFVYLYYKWDYRFGSKWVPWFTFWLNIY